MNTYIRERLRADACHLVARGQAEEELIHQGLKGRFRELLVDSILAPWLPAYAACGTGMIVDDQDRKRDSTQEDVIVFDRSVVPAVLAHHVAVEGVFPLDGVLARVEVKSKLNRTELRGSVDAAKEIYGMTFTGGGHRLSIAPISAIFAFASDLKGDRDDELRRLLSVVDEAGLYNKPPCQGLPGPITVLCVVGRGCWAYWGVEKHTEQGVEKRSFWMQAKMVHPHDEVLVFISAISNSCFLMHADRQGFVRDPARGAGGGIGNFVLDGDIWEESKEGGVA